MSLPDIPEPGRVVRDGADFFTYETIRFEGHLTIEEGGRVAWFARRQLVRFLEDGATVFIDRVWGDGVLFAGYDIGSTPIIDAIRTRKGYAVLLGLPKQFRRGETFEIETERKIVGAFSDRDAYWELAMSAPTESLSLRVSDRSERLMRAVRISAIGLRGVDVRQRDRFLELRVDSPALYTSYRLDWRWN